MHYWVAFCGVDTDMIDRRPISPAPDKTNSREDEPFGQSLEVRLNEV